MENAAAASNRLVLNFVWTGPNTLDGGSFRNGLDVRIVNLVFQNVRTNISVKLPQDINPSAPRKLPFTCLKESRETHPDSLSVTTDQVRNLVLKAEVFKKDRAAGSCIIDFSSTTVFQARTVLKSDRTIGLQIPEELELGRTYSLVILSNDNLFLSACLIKEESIPNVVQNLVARRD